MKKVKSKEHIEAGTVLYCVRFPDEDVWHTNAVSAMNMWERYSDESNDEITLWQRYRGRDSRIR